MILFLLAARIGWFAEGRFLGRVLDGWVVDAQEFIRYKLPHLLVVAAIAFLLNRLLRLVTHRMIRVAERRAAFSSRRARTAISVSTRGRLIGSGESGDVSSTSVSPVPP